MLIGKLIENGNIIEIQELKRIGSCGQMYAKTLSYLDDITGEEGYKYIHIDKFDEISFDLIEQYD